MIALITGAAAFAQQHAIEVFGTDSTIWWPASASAGATYTIAVPCAAGTLSTGSRETLGLPTLPQDSRRFYCTLTDFPFPPQPDMVFVFGPPGSTGAFDPAASRKYLITGAQVFGHQLVITASDHGPAAP